MVNYDLIELKLKEMRMSKRKLALLAGIKPTTLQTAFRRRSGNFSASRLSRIAEVLNVSVLDLLMIYSASQEQDDIHSTTNAENERLSQENKRLLDENVKLKARLYDLEHPAIQSGIDWSVFDMTMKGGEENHGDNELVDGLGAERGDYAL